jgi:hypothetical protein
LGQRGRGRTRQHLFELSDQFRDRPPRIPSRIRKHALQIKLRSQSDSRAMREPAVDSVTRVSLISASDGVCGTDLVEIRLYGVGQGDEGAASAEPTSIERVGLRKMK